MSTIAGTTPVSKPALWTGRLLSGLVILFMLFDGAIKLVPWPVVTESMEKIGYGSSETLARSLGVISLVCTILYASGSPTASGMGGPNNFLLGYNSGSSLGSVVIGLWGILTFGPILARDVYPIIANNIVLNASLTIFAS